MRRSSGARALYHLVGMGRSGLRAPGRQVAPLASKLEPLAVPVLRKCAKAGGCSQQWRGFAQHAGAEQGSGTSSNTSTESAERAADKPDNAEAETGNAEAEKAEASKDAEAEKAHASKAEASKTGAEEAGKADADEVSKDDGSESEELSPEEKLQQEFEELQDQSRMKKKELLLALADFENNKKKFMKEREGRRKTANTNFARRMVDIYREFEDLPAFNSTVEKAEGSPCVALQEGVTMTKNLFAAALDKSDVERLSIELGTPVVNARHEVVGSTPGDGSLPDGSIAEVIEAGWMMDLRSQTPRVLHKAKIKTVGSE